MAGHSKWHNIQHRKSAQDTKRGKIFTKIIREITVSTKMGGIEPNSNPRLRTAIDKALSANMAKDTIQRAVNLGSRNSNGNNMIEVCYEGYGPHGVAVIVYCITENKNRTVSEVRNVFTKMGGKLGTDGSVSYLFNKIGLISFPPNSNQEKIIEVAISSGATDVTLNDDGIINLITTPKSLMDVKNALLKVKLEPKHAEVRLIASKEVTLNEDQAMTMIRFSDMLESLDDVQNIYSNANIQEDILEKL